MDTHDTEAGPAAWLEPGAFRDGEPLAIHIANCLNFRGQTVQVELGYVTAVDSGWCMSTSIALDADGNGVTTIGSGLSMGVEAAVVVTRLRDAESGVCEEIVSAWPSTLNSTKSASVSGKKVLAELLACQQHLYKRPLGSQADNSIEHRIVVLVEGLLLTELARLPGWSLQPLSPRLTMEEHRLVMNKVVRDLGWATADVVGVDPWRSRASSAYPLCAAVFPEIWAETYESAGQIALERVNLALALLSANRGAAGRSVVVVIQQRQPNNGVVTKVSLPGTYYPGNLVGGLIAGEDQRFFLNQIRVAESDPVVRLGYELLAEAMRDRSVDARYFRYWSILELLSGARISPGQVVTLVDGSPWPDERNNTTTSAAPRVYQYLRPLATPSHDAAAGPGESLYERVRIWYARRNATAHYGRLIPGDSRQVSKSWYQWAICSVGDLGEPLGQLSMLKQTVISALSREVMASSGLD